MKQLLVCLAVTASLSVFAQDSTKKVINNQTYDIWNSIQNVVWSKNGDYISYRIGAPKADQWLYLQNSKSLKKDSILKGEGIEFNSNSKYAVFNITAGYDTIRALKLKDTKPSKFPKDSLGIIWLGKDSILKIASVNSFELAKEGNWMAYLSSEDTRAECPTYKKWQIFKKKKKCDRPKTTGKSLAVFNPLTGDKTIIHQVVNYRFNKPGTSLFYSTSEKGGSDTLSLFQIDLKTKKVSSIIENQLAISSFTIDESGNQVAFTTTTDTNKIKTFHLAYWTIGNEKATIIVDTNSTGIKDNWAVSEYSNTYFSKDGKSVFFGTNSIVEQEPKDTLLSSEKAKLDVWSWTDKQIQPQQLRRVKRKKKETFTTIVNLSTSQITHLETEENESVFVNAELNRTVALGRNTNNYLKSNSWDFPWKADYFIVDLVSGQKKEMLNKQAYFPSLSPSGNYLVWYNGADSCWMSTSIENNTSVNLTKNINDLFYSDNNGNPSDPYPEGAIGWTNKNGVERILIKSKHDIHEFNPTNISDQTIITKGLGKTNLVKYTLLNFEEDSTYINVSRCFFKGVDQLSKNEFIIKNSDFTRPYLAGAHKILDIRKAPESKDISFRVMTVSAYPNLYLTDFDFSKKRVLTNANPQQTDYNWATVEQVRWESYKGLELQGLLYKPEDFDPSKKYPMIVYFYEKNDDRLHSYYSPKPTASIVFPTEYASNGYLVFIPNILYTPGHPAQSAFDCIVSGTDYLTEKYNWIDSNKLALQGQSWGGYQTAQLITMTDKYACGMAGAPVSNMFSAYGGIRWGSGMSRMFQYEKTQSRIGCTIWDCPELYIENSPIFGLPKVSTPLLIMHNDNDGAVPWYQGIEMFMGLRRLEKPVWMLNYNGDQHNLMQNANREDLSLRMRQFFDYYLKDEPMPLWMKNGVPAVEKGNPSNLQLESVD
ncbi:MAG: alpha/beta hydrolase family protein [Crocinitomicaceae bacterium]